MAETITGETKREGQKRPKDAQPAGFKKRDSLSHGRKLSHPWPF